MRKLWCKKERS